VECVSKTWCGLGLVCGVRVGGVGSSSGGCRQQQWGESAAAVVVMVHGPSGLDPTKQHVTMPSELDPMGKRSVATEAIRQ
jgi:L-aminopeptidase/D-esterase-like protein